MTLEEAIDELYGVGLDAFVPLRSKLVRELRAQGDEEAAEQVAKLRKPTVFAWAMNQLARRERRDIDLLLDAGHRLREAQAGVLRGSGRDEFERAREIEKDAIRRLGRAGERLLAEERGGASGAVLQQIATTLRTAAVSEQGRELLARGRFVVPLESEGFGALAGLAPDAAPAPSPRSKGATDEARKKELRAARQRVRELELHADASAERAARLLEQSAVAQREAEEAREAAERAARDVKRLESSS